MLTLKKNNVSVDYMTVHKDRETNYHYVLWYEDERTILVKHQEYEYSLPSIDEPRWIYLSSLASNTLPYHREIVKYLSDHPNVKLAFQPGTFQMKFGADSLSAIYKRADIVFCNVDEAKRILGIFEETEILELLKKMSKLGPKTTVITDGPKGAYAFDGISAWFMPTYPDPKPPFERTGAGDAFSSTFASSIALGMSVPQALAWGAINSMSVVQYVGAQKGLLVREKLEKFLDGSPESFRAKLLS